jgi:hypothetical protein
MPVCGMTTYPHDACEPFSTVEAIYTGGDPLPPVIVSKKINSILPERWLVMNDIKLMAFINLEASLWSR